MVLLGWFVVALAAVGCFVGGKVTLALVSRALDLAERQVALTERAHDQRAKQLQPPAIPPELTRRIMQWGSTDAQENERAIILSLYAEHGDWNTVKRHLPPEPKDEWRSELLN